MYLVIKFWIIIMFWKINMVVDIKRFVSIICLLYIIILCNIGKIYSCSFSGDKNKEFVINISWWFVCKF